MIRILVACAALTATSVMMTGNANATEPTTPTQITDQTQIGGPTDMSSARRRYRHRHYHRRYAAPGYYERPGYYYDGPGYYRDGYAPGWGPAPFPFIFGLPRFD